MYSSGFLGKQRKACYMLPLDENVIVIHDSDPHTFVTWLFLMCVIFILYFIVSSVHNINRKKKLEEMKKKYEEKEADGNLDNI